MTTRIRIHGARPITEEESYHFKTKEWLNPHSCTLYYKDIEEIPAKVS